MAAVSKETDWFVHHAREFIGKKLIDVRASEGGAFVEYWFEGDVHHDWPMENIAQVLERARKHEKENAH